ncbi:extracellular ligand-gated ion channel protein [Perilla frutescens var. hirtella]|uniref:Extracellular ligand-gated ion channel protein n=1 Tax=Perilla frutescens var. hirtella TaxID=608512 RepID=A0AAD4IX49_PERFH|nr:extracellular ligand-gated ion channel protein [Perilla frutescens var. frutescens]KAH6786347.1 extracellular ligand-gated ion channel protein [Perilla frutescens var. hirtella]KAH6822678.1 extracellular ligand-gated ion channel protein [Perilla frutescens var. hirtella]
MGDERERLLNKNKGFSRSVSHARDELHSFRTWLRWLCVDQSNAWTVCLSWFVFLLFAILVPAVSHFVLSCSDCDSRHSRPYDAVAQLSLSGVAAISFICLSTFVRRYGLRRFLFFDKLRNESETVRQGYTEQLNRSLKILFIFVLPCFAAETVYKIWWYSSGGSKIPFLGNVVVSNTVACILDLCSWFYRTVVFFLVCVLFRLLCSLQILRMQDFALVFQGNSDVESVLKEHLRIRRQLRIISHRYRSFILWGLISITASQFASLLMATRPNANLDIFNSGELAVCSVSLLAGLLILLRSAARITHKAQGVTCLAAKWHVCATVDSFDTVEGETPVAKAAEEQAFSENCSVSSDCDDVGDEEDELDNTRFIPSYAYSTISFQKRQALVTYFENNRAGITVYGFMLDRSSLHTIFGIELSLVLWLLGKTIGIS